MGIFTRFRDIVGSNINSMLDRAEDPEKLIRLMIQEMEDTLIELKAACAGVMAESKKIERQLLTLEKRVGYWEDKANLAVNKGRDDLAKEALLEKRRYHQRTESLTNELTEHDALLGQYKDDIRQLEEKLKSAREKERLLVQRHIHAARKKRAQEEMRRMDNADAIFKFEDRIGAVQPPHFFLGLSLAGGMNVALHQHAFFFPCIFQFVFQLSNVFLVLRQQSLVLR